VEQGGGVRVAFLPGSLSRAAGGFFESVRALARALHVRAGVEIAVFGLRDEFYSRDLSEWAPVRVEAFPIRGPRSFGWALRLRQALAGYKPDLVHLHGLWMHSSLVARDFGRRTGRPVVVSPRGMLDPWALRNSHLKKQVARWLFEGANLRKARCIHALSDAECQAVRAFGLRQPVCIVPNGVEMSAAVTDPPPWASVMPPGAMVLLYLGRLHPKKNLINLVKAWSAVQRDDAFDTERWHLVIIGWDQGGYERALREAAEQEDLGNVHFLGPKFGKEKEAAFSHAAAFILPSLSEGLQMVVLEAWAHALPVLMTAECNLREGFGAGAACRIGPEADSIAGGIRSLIRMSESERHGIGQRGRELAERQFTWESIARRMHEAYMWLLDGGAPPACVRASSSVTRPLGSGTG
jgi:glycosyltransferase involved in cell wall biosynthesis